MAKLKSEKFEITVSKIIRDNESLSDELMSDELIEQLESILVELIADNVLVEIRKVE